MIPFIIYTDFYLLYKCLVKLGTIKEKRLIIDIIALRQSYKCCEIAEIQWIYRDNNPLDTMMKAALN